MGCFCLHNHVNQFFIISLLQSCDSILLENPDYKEVNPSDSVKPPLTSWLEFMRDSQLEAPSWTVPKFLIYRNGVGFPGGSDGKEPACNSGDLVWSLCQEDYLENRMATHSSILAWRIPWTQRNLAGYSPWGHKESDMNEWLTLPNFQGYFLK